MFKLIWPDESVPADVQVLEPENAPVIAPLVPVPVPVADVVHDAYGGSNPPAGTDSENCSADPEIVPDTVPRPPTEAPVAMLVAVIVMVPENDEPDCVSTQAIVPEPDESDAVPDQVPAMLFGVLVGVDGDGASLPPLEHAVAARASANTAATLSRRIGLAGRGNVIGI